MYWLICLHTNTVNGTGWVKWSLSRSPELFLVSMLGCDNLVGQVNKKKMPWRFEQMTDHHLAGKHASYCTSQSRNIYNAAQIYHSYLIGVCPHWAYVYFFFIYLQLIYFHRLIPVINSQITNKLALQNELKIIKKALTSYLIVNYGNIKRKFCVLMQKTHNFLPNNITFKRYHLSEGTYSNFLDVSSHFTPHRSLQEITKQLSHQ